MEVDQLFWRVAAEVSVFSDFPQSRFAENILYLLILSSVLPYIYFLHPLLFCRRQKSKRMFRNVGRGRGGVGVGGPEDVVRRNLMYR